MAKLFNGSVWTRAAVKDHNKFQMSNTFLCLVMTLRIEEWYISSRWMARLACKRFLMFPSAPRLDRAALVLEDSVYGRDTDAAQKVVLPLSLLVKFVNLSQRTETAHDVSCADYNSIHEFIPYFFAVDALEYFQQHYDAQVHAQELSYLQDTKNSATQAS